VDEFFGCLLFTNIILSSGWVTFFLVNYMSWWGASTTTITNGKFVHSISCGNRMDGSGFGSHRHGTLRVETMEQLVLSLCSSSNSLSSRGNDAPRSLIVE